MFKSPKWVVRIYHLKLLAVYSILWGLVFGALTVLAIYWPEAVLGYLRLADPVTKWIGTMFWKAFAPTETQEIVSRAAPWVMPWAQKAGRMAADVAGPRGMILMRLSFNGFLMISATALLLRWPFACYFRRQLVKQLQAK